MKPALIPAFAALALALASGCAIIPDTPRVGQEAAAQGAPVAIGQPVWLGDVILTPIRVTEDSRCPMNARCVWAGRVVVETRITATHWQQTAPVTLGEPYEVLGRRIALVSVTPDRRTDTEIDPRQYRLVYESR